MFVYIKEGASDCGKQGGISEEVRTEIRVNCN